MLTTGRCAYVVHEVSQRPVKVKEQLVPVVVPSPVRLCLQLLSQDLSIFLALPVMAFSTTHYI